MADNLVASVLRAVGPETNVIVVGDHGQDLQHTTFRTNEWLAAEGLLKWEGETSEVDWRSTRAYATGNYIYLNQQGREPHGLVPPAEVENIKQEIVDKLLELTDVSTGSRPVLIAGNKEDFELLGANGDGVGDLVFCVRSGYQATNDRGNVFSPTTPLREFTSGHDHFWPLDPRIHTRLFAAGPGFRRGYVHPHLAQVLDVAPTVCEVLGIGVPRHCRGHVLKDLLARTPLSSTFVVPMTTELNVGL
jgi:predicted AlkP superfamily phosphohydrolase/phosphomutase